MNSDIKCCMFTKCYKHYSSFINNMVQSESVEIMIIWIFVFENVILTVVYIHQQLLTN